MEFIHQPAPANRLGDYLKANLSTSGPWTQFRAAVAFTKHSGTKHIAPSLSAFAKVNPVEIIVGIDHRGTSLEGLSDLVEAVGSRGRLIVFHNRLPFTFHPKIYLFKSATAAEAILGSGNLTEGGLFTNYEAAFRLSFDLTDPIEKAGLQSIETVLNAWADPARGTAHILDENLLNRLVALGLVPKESLVAPEMRDAMAPQAIGAGGVEDEVKTEHLFAARPESRAPTTPSATSAEEVSKSRTGTTGFVMTLQRTDVGVGQTTTGTARRSPEIFIPLSARDANPDFWQWPDAFISDQSKPGKFDRPNVRMRLGGQIISVNLMTWPDKHDFRLRSEALRSAGNIGDIMRLERVDAGSNFEYYVEIIPKGTTQFSLYEALCTVPVRNSKKHYGYY